MILRGLAIKASIYNNTWKRLIKSYSKLPDFPVISNRNTKRKYLALKISIIFVTHNQKAVQKLPVVGNTKFPLLSVLNV